MKPNNIFLVRHGQSEGNVNKEIYTQKPDYAYQLTELGKDQAFNAGIRLAAHIGSEPAMFYCSPFWRTRQTLEQITNVIKPYKIYEDPRLREQEWGTTFRKKHDGMDSERDSYGHFYYRIPNGESCADVYDRVSDFLNTMYRDFEKEDYPRNTIIVNHGMTMRVFLMRFFHYSVEEFEILANPHNCDIVHLQLQEDGKYKLLTEMRKYDSYNHNFQYQKS